MSDKNYFELTEEINGLQGALDNQTNEEIRLEITEHISKVKTFIVKYDLGDDDLFKCQRCDGVFDIEDSIQIDGDELVCSEKCANELG
ncbi:MAG: hypothetical protein ACI936_000041 [Paraglaciecola sp.]|jgi:hypothetical protein